MFWLFLLLKLPGKLPLFANDGWPYKNTPVLLLNYELFVFILPVLLFMPCSFYFAPTNYVPDSVMYYIIYIGKSVAIAKFFVFYSPLPYPNIAISIFLSNLFPLMNLLIESKACLSSISNDLPYL